MFRVSQEIDFCYGHRLLDYDGLCQHPHGHNAIAEIEVRADSLDRLNMVVDFGDIKDLVKAWIDRSRKRPRTIHHLGRGTFMVAGRTIRLPSRMR